MARLETILRSWRGRAGELKVGIINQERETVTYRVEVANEFCSIRGVPGSGWSKLGSSLTSN